MLQDECQTNLLSPLTEFILNLGCKICPTLPRCARSWQSPFQYVRRRRFNHRDSFGNQSEWILAVKHTHPGTILSHCTVPRHRLGTSGTEIVSITDTAVELCFAFTEELSTGFECPPSLPPPYVDIPPYNGAVLEKQRPMMRAHEDQWNSSSALLAPVLSRPVESPAEGSSPIQGSTPVSIWVRSLTINLKERSGEDEAGAGGSSGSVSFIRFGFGRSSETIAVCSFVSFPFPPSKAHSGLVNTDPFLRFQFINLKSLYSSFQMNFASLSALLGPYESPLR